MFGGATYYRTAAGPGQHKGNHAMPRTRTPAPATRPAKRTRRAQLAARATALGRAIMWGEIGMVVGYVAALASPRYGLAIGAVITVIFSIIGT